MFNNFLKSKSNRLLVYEKEFSVEKSLKDAYESLKNPDFVNKYFNLVNIISKDESTANHLYRKKSPYFFRITQEKQFHQLTGMVETDEIKNFPNIIFEWNLTPQSNIVVIKFCIYSDRKKQPLPLSLREFIGILPAGGTIALISTINSVDAVTHETMPIMSSVTPSTSTTESVASSIGSSVAKSTTTTSLLASKPILASIVAAILVTGGMTGSYMLDPTLFGNEYSDNIPTTNIDSTSHVTSSDTDMTSSNSQSISVNSKSSSVSSASDVSTSQSLQSLSQEISPAITQNESLQTSDSNSDSNSATGSGVSGQASNSSPTTQSQTSTTTISIPTDLTLPPGSTTSRVTDVQTDRDGNTWAVDSPNNRVVKFYSDGKPPLIIGSDVLPVSYSENIIAQNIPLFFSPSMLNIFPSAHADSSISLNNPKNIVIDDNNKDNPINVYISDNVDASNDKPPRIVKVNSNGEYLGEFSHDIFATINDIAVDGKYLYVVDSLNTIHRFNSEKFDRTIDGPIETSDIIYENYIFSSNTRIEHIEIDDQYLYTLDATLGRVFVFDSDGTAQKSIILLDDQNKEILPFTFTMNESKTHFYVTDIFNNFYKYDLHGGEPLNSDTLKLSGNGIMTGIDVDSNGVIRVVDSNTSNITAIIETDELSCNSTQDTKFVLADEFAKLVNDESICEDTIVAFSQVFDGIKCDTNSIIKNPITVPSEIVDALPISELTTKANNFAQTGQHDEALLFYYIASQIAPDKHVFTGIGNEQILLCNNNNNSPLDAYNHVLDTFDPTHIHAINGKGNFYANQAQLQSFNSAPVDLVESTAGLATKNYKEVLQLDGSNINALNGLGTIHIILEQYNTAITLFEKSLAINSERITTLNGMAFAHLKSGNLILAESFYNDTLDIDGTNFDALSGLLSIYLQQDKQDKVSETISKLAQFQEQVIQSLIEEGEWLLENGSVNDAKRFFEKVLELDPGNETAESLLRNI